MPLFCIYSTSAFSLIPSLIMATIVQYIPCLSLSLTDLYTQYSYLEFTVFCQHPHLHLGMQSFLLTPLLMWTASFTSLCRHSHKLLPPFCLHLSPSMAHSSTHDMVHRGPHFSASTAVVHNQIRIKHTTMATGKQQWSCVITNASAN